MANPLPLSISPFKNPSGAVVFRVAGTIRGQRIRRNFTDELSAQLFINRHVGGANSRARPIITTLPKNLLRRAEAAFLRLPAGADILEAVDYFAEHFRPVKPLPIAERREDITKAGDAVDAFEEWLRTQRKCEEITIQTRTKTLRSFAREHHVDRSDRITVEKAKAWIYSSKVEVRTQRDRFDLLNWFCEFLVDRKLAATNPVAEFAKDRPVVKVKAPGVFTFDEVWRLLQCALTDAEGPQMLPFFAICVLSGVRPDEVPRLSSGCVDDKGKPDPWGDFCLEDEHPIIEVNKAKGGRSRRQVRISEPLLRILRWCKEQKLAPNFFSKRKFDRIRRRAGLLNRWEKDVLRHTYASHEYAVTRGTKQLEGDMGNSERVLFQNYIRPVPRGDGFRFHGLVLHYSAPRERSAMGTGKSFAGRSQLHSQAQPTNCQNQTLTRSANSRAVVQLRRP